MVNWRPGFSLVEVVVAMTLLAVGALGVAATSIVAVQSFTRAELTQAVLREAEMLLDSLAALDANTAGMRKMHQGTISWSAADSSGLIILRVRSDQLSFELTALR